MDANKLQDGLTLWVVRDDEQGYYIFGTTLQGADVQLAARRIGDVEPDIQAAQRAATEAAASQAAAAPAAPAPAAPAAPAPAVTTPEQTPPPAPEQTPPAAAQTPGGGTAAQPAQPAAPAQPAQP